MKNTPFRYPKERHVRKENPPQYRTTKPYKPFLRKEFEQKCVYCMMPDTMKGQDSFAVEHYLPKSKFPYLQYDYRNLYYACRCCNSYKGDFYPDLQGTKSEHFVPNPCEHSMFEHMRFQASHVNGHTNAGRFTIDLLQLNDEKVVKYREFIMDLIGTVIQKINALQSTLDEISQMDMSDSRVDADEVKMYREEIEGEMRVKEASLDRLLGKLT